MQNNQMSDKGMELLMSIEAFRGISYVDQNDNNIFDWVKGATIGYGHLISQDEWNQSGNSYINGITKEQAKVLFTDDLSPFIDGVNAKVTTAISQNQIRCARHFSFQYWFR